MKALLRGGLLAIVFTLFCGCAGPGDSQERARKAQGTPVRIEFTRPSWVYEKETALFAMINETRRVLWFDGTDAESPDYQVRGATRLASTNRPALDRIPLLPGEKRHFFVTLTPSPGPVSVGITFYPARSATNGVQVWSSAANVRR
jgi:hypothetical protein